MKYEVEPHKYDSKDKRYRRELFGKFHALDRKKDRRFVEKVAYPGVQGLFLELLNNDVDRDEFKKLYWKIFKEMKGDILASGNYNDVYKEYICLKKLDNKKFPLSKKIRYCIIRDTVKMAGEEAEETAERVRAQVPKGLEGKVGMAYDYEKKELEKRGQLVKKMKEKYG